MAVKFTNNAKTTLASGITSSATSATVTDGSVFPSLSSGEHFYCTFDDGTNNEIVKVTARSGNTLTIVRAADNTTARAFSSGNQAELRATAALLTDIQENIAAKSANQTVYNTTTASSATTYDVGTDPGVEGNAMVFLNGVLQHHDTISFSGSTLTFDAAPPNGMALEVIIDNLINLQSSNLTVDTFTAADVVGVGPQTDFTLSDTPAAEQNLIVFVDGVFQAQDAYTISNEVLTMTDGVTAGLDVTVYVINPVNIGTPSNSTVTSAKLSGDITTPGALSVSGAFTSQGIDDNADATAITIGSDENVTLNNRLIFPTSNIGTPDISDHTTGTRIDYYPSSGAVFYGTGIASNSLWTMAHKNHLFYIGEGSGTKVARINDEGITVPNASADGTGTVGTGDQTNSGLEAGMIYFNTTNKVFRGYDGSNWNDLGKGSISQIQGLQLWADVTDGISSTTVADLSGNSRTGTLANTTDKGTLSSNTYVDMVNAQYCQYATGVLPDLPIKNSGACSFFFVCTNRRSNASMGAYMASTSSGVGYQIIRHQSTSDDYSLYLEGATDSVHSSSNTAVPTNSTISEAYIIFFQFQGNSGGIDFEVFKHENGTTSTDSFFLSGVSTGAFAWTDNNQPVRIGNSPWASEELDAGMFAWGFTDTMLTPRERKIIIDYYEAKGLAT